MRRSLIFLGAAAALLAGVALALPFVVPVDAYRSRIEERASEATGRALKIEGPLRLTVFPELGISAQKVTLANVPGGHAPYFATMDSLRVGVKLLPLLAGKVEVSEVTLERPVIALEADRSGKGNWALGRREAEEGPAAAPESGGAKPSFAGVRIRDGRITYRDDATGETRTLDGIDLTVALTRFDAPVAIDGSLTAGGAKITLAVRIEAPQALMDGAPSPVDLSLTSELLQASFRGSLAGAGNAEGVLKLDAPSLRKLLAWAGEPVGAGGGLGRLSLEGNLTARGKLDSFSAIKLVLDRMTVTGSLSVDRSRAIPFLSGRLAVDQLDLNPYMAGAAGGSAAPSGAPPESGWSRKPIDLSTLGLMDAKLALSANALRIRHLTLGRTAAAVTLNNGALTADLNPISLYGGSGRAVLSVDAHGTTPRIANTARFDGLAVRPFLADTLGVSRIEGTGSVTMDVTAAGRSPDAIMHALAGKGAISFRNGRIKGVDLASVARTIQSALAGSATSAGASTGFTEMAGSFTIANGVMTNRDFRLTGPYIGMTGAGNVNLGEQTIDFVVNPKAVLAANGQTAPGAAGIGIPFRIHGSWSHLHYSPDLSGVARDILQSIKRGGISTKSVLEGLLGGQSAPQNQQNGTSPQKKTSPLDALKSLFGPH